MDSFLYDVIISGQPQKSLKEWEDLKASKDFTFEKMDSIQNSLHIAKWEVSMTDDLKQKVDKALKELEQEMEMETMGSPEDRDIPSS